MTSQLPHRFLGWGLSNKAYKIINITNKNQWCECPRKHFICTLVASLLGNIIPNRGSVLSIYICNPPSKKNQKFFYGSSRTFFFVWGLEPKSPKKNASPDFFKKAYFTNLIKFGPELEKIKSRGTENPKQAQFG